MHGHLNVKLTNSLLSTWCIAKPRVNVAWYKDCNNQVIVAVLKEDQVPLLTPVYAYVPAIYVFC